MKTKVFKFAIVALFDLEITVGGPVTNEATV